jgi:hypothetical protein
MRTCYIPSCLSLSKDPVIEHGWTVPVTIALFAKLASTFFKQKIPLRLDEKRIDSVEEKRSPEVSEPGVPTSAGTIEHTIRMLTYEMNVRLIWFHR